MKHILTRFLISAALGLFCCSCADVSIPVNPPAPVYGSTPAPAPAASNARFRLIAGADLDQAQVVYPGGPSIAIAGLRTSPGMQLVTGVIGDATRWWGMGKVAGHYFKDRTAAAKQAGMTSRAKIGADASVRTAEINAFKPVEALPAVAPVPVP